MINSRIAFLVGCVVVVFGVACQKPAATATAAASPPSTAARTPGITADKTAGQDGALTGDSANDGVISLSIDGPISALSLVIVDANGALSGAQQWDTVVEQQPMPAGWKSAFAVGSDTWQLGVEENGAPLNAANGSLKPVGVGPHTLTLFVGDATYFKGTEQLMVLAEKPDHTIIKSNLFKM